MRIKNIKDIQSNSLIFKIHNVNFFNRSSSLTLSLSLHTHTYKLLLKLYQKKKKPVQSCDIQAQINVQTRDVQTHLGLGLQPDNMVHTVPKPKPHVALKPNKQKIFISSHHPRFLGHTRSTVSQERKPLLDSTISQLLDSTLGISIQSISAEVGSNSDATPTILH